MAFRLRAVWAWETPAAPLAVPDTAPAMVRTIPLSCLAQGLMERDSPAWGESICLCQRQQCSIPPMPAIMLLESEPR